MDHTESFDVERLRIGVQALEDHTHTLLEAHAEAPLVYTKFLHEVIDVLLELQMLLAEQGPATE